jgi:hypothetical protein
MFGLLSEISISFTIRNSSSEFSKSRDSKYSLVQECAVVKFPSVR